MGSWCWFDSVYQQSGNTGTLGDHLACFLVTQATHRTPIHLQEFVPDTDTTGLCITNCVCTYMCGGRTPIGSIAHTHTLYLVLGIWIYLLMI